MKKLFALFFFLYSFLSFGQIKLITGGVIIEQSDDDNANYGIRIENLRSFAKTYSNYDGHFSIPATIGDTIQFTSGYLVPRKIVISDNIYKKGVLQVHLDIETIQLAEAIIGNGLNKDFKSNISYKRDLKGEIYNNIGLDQRLRDLRPQKDISKFKATDVLSPVRIIGHLNGYYKKERRIQEFERKQNILNEIINYFPDEYFLEQLKIPNYKVQEFLEYADHKIDIRKRVLNRQFELIEIELEPIAVMYLEEFKNSNQK